MIAEPLSSGAISHPEDDPRALAATVVHAIYRLIKGCFLHDDANQAIATLVESVVEATGDLVRRTQAPSASVLFANNSVFVNRQMLRASRETYQIALDLGALLAPCNITEVTLHPGIGPGEVQEFGRAVAAMHREKKLSPMFTEGGWAHLKVRKVVGFGGGQVLPAVTRVSRTYAASIMIVRAFYADQRKGKSELSHGLKRVAQKISGALDDEKRLLLSTAAAPAADADRAGVAVSTAILSVLIASQLTDDRTALTNLAMAALLYDAARIRLARSENDTQLRTLNEEEEERLPASGVVALTALGKLHPPSVVRSVILYEALALRSPTTPPYGGGRSPHVLSRILAVARGFSELRVARGSSAPLSIDDAVDVLMSQAADNTTRSLVKLLVGTLGVFPAGTMVELSTGELAVVVSTPRFPIDFGRPPVRILYDESARLLEEPLDIDLANPPKGAPKRVIKKPVDASDQQMKQMRAFVISYAKKKSEAASPEPPPARAAAPVPAPPPRASEPKASSRDAEVRPRRAAIDPRADDDAPPPLDVVAGRLPPAAPPHDPPAPVSRKSSLPPPRAVLPDAVEDEPGPRSASLEPRRAPPAPPSAKVRPEATSPAVDPASSRKKAQPFGRRPPAPPPTPPQPSMGVEKRATREIDWAKVAAVPENVDLLEPTEEVSETDALLARYLSEGSSSPGVEPTDLDRESRGSAGLRWDRPSSGKRVDGLSSMADPPSARRSPDRSTGGLRWGADPASSSGRNAARPPDSDKLERPAPPPPAPDTPESPASSGAASGRAKAGNLGWGTPRRGDK